MQLYNVCHVCTVNAKYARLGFFFFGSVQMVKEK